MITKPIHNREFVTTLTELKAINAPAAGLKPEIGNKHQQQLESQRIVATQNKFWRFSKVARLSWIACTTSVKRSRINII